MIMLNLKMDIYDMNKYILYFHIISSEYVRFAIMCCRLGAVIDNWLVGLVDIDLVNFE